MTAHHVTFDTPVGPLTVSGDEDAVTGIWVGDRTVPPPATVLGEAVEEADASAVVQEAARQLREYFAGERTTFELPLAPGGTAFQQRVWALLRDIPYGRTMSYGEIARELGQPGAARAVGLANGRNPVSIVVPCHRVVGSNGSLTGYAGGVARKQQLLEHERRTAGHQLF